MNAQRERRPFMSGDYDWQRPYLAAVLETDPSKLARHVEDAHAAIKARIRELEQDHMGTPEERAAIQYALNCLLVLKKEIPSAA